MRCPSCGEEVEYRRENKRWWGAGIGGPSSGVPGYLFGRTVGLARAGGGISGAWPIGIALFVIGALGGWIVGSSFEAAPCPACGEDIKLD